MIEEKSVEVTYKFYLPEHNEELSDFQNHRKYMICLDEIFNKCRSLIKHGDSTNEDLLKFAEEIRGMAWESGIFDHRR